MFVVIPITAFIASLLTFFSGFGLGTILLPVFAIYFNIETAIALTAIVHFINNIFKISFTFKNISFSTLMSFGIPSLLAAFVGALYLKYVTTNSIVFYQYHLFNSDKIFKISLAGISIGLVMLLFAFVELFNFINQFQITKKHLVAGGLLSGFFGGLTGHQGALRSAFLIHSNLSKEQFVATGTAIACLVDISRMSIYMFTLNFLVLNGNKLILVITIIAALMSVILGQYLLKKTTFKVIKWLVALFLILMSLLLIFGIIV